MKRKSIDFYQIRFGDAGLSAPDACRILGIQPRTLREWEQKQEAPAWACNMVLSQVEITHPGWQGWRFFGGLLYSPEGETFTPGEIRALRYCRELLKR